VRAAPRVLYSPEPVSLSSLFSVLAAQPARGALPARLPNPFAAEPPHALARQAAEALQRELADWPAALRDELARGKMLGVLVARDAEGRVGTLRAFAGMLAGRWDLEGFARPVFDLAARNALWPEAERRLRELDAAIGALDAGPGVDRRERDALERRRAEHSRGVLEELLVGYRLANARGEVRSVRELFAPDAPAGGAGDCAGPKLFAHAQRAGLQPLALAEFWWGASPAQVERLQGAYYPSCPSKCGRVLTHMLQGWDVEPLVIPGPAPIAPELPRTLYEDQWLVVVDKPAGLPPVPGRHGGHRDCLLARLRARYPDAAGPLLVQRLDADTSGVTVVAKDRVTFFDLRRQLALHQLDARYVALVRGDAPGDGGTIALALRPDPEDRLRLRQRHDPIDGERALTAWTALERRDGLTRVAFEPRTARPHQLRVHAAHALGLGAPIVGDRLYGTPAERLYLHAESVRFVHPRSGVEHLVTSPAPF
jgi:tRNA pseudouridine32 synthase/23S rRNA pseudouridine746 synthase